MLLTNITTGFKGKQVKRSKGIFIIVTKKSPKKLIGAFIKIKKLKERISTAPLPLVRWWQRVSQGITKKKQGQ